VASTPPKSDVRTSMSAVVLRAARKLAVNVEGELQEPGLGIDHWLAMDSLAASAGLTMAELQALTLTPGPTLTRIVDRLVAQSLAYREVDAVDRRKVRVYLSDRGIAAHRRMIVMVGAAEAQWAEDERDELRAAIDQALPIA